MDKRKLFRLMLSVFILAIMLAGISSVKSTLAQTGGGYDLSWSTVDNGGGTIGGGGYSLISTVGQPDVGNALAGGGYTLTGGFWPGTVSGSSSGSGTNVYLPVVLKN